VQWRPLLLQMARGKFEKLRQVALVGGGGVSRGVAIEPEVVQKVEELLLHGYCDNPTGPPQYRRVWGFP
jgi:hypothetical protein